VFCGTPEFAVPTLGKLVEAGHRVRLVVTRPDRPSGRGMEWTASPIKEHALELSLPVAQPDKIKSNEEFRGQLAALNPDGIIVVGYGRIIPQWMLDLPPLGNINLHASLLPKYRGAAPIQWAVASGENITGVTTMRIDAGLDTGDVLLQKEIPIGPKDTADTLSPQLAVLGAELMIATLDGLQQGKIKPQPQDHAKATLAPILQKEDGRIDFGRSAQEICNRLRGFQPWPGAFTTFRSRHLQIRDAVVQTRTLPPGELLVEGARLLVGCAGDSALAPLELQPEGKKRMALSDFIHGYRPKSGEKFGAASL
jgi:methionyl-tRNA formyltransferase